MRLHHITGDDVVFVYDHSQGDKPRVGDSYYVKETASGATLVVQIVALESFNYPSLGEVLMRQLMEDSYGSGQVQTFAGTANAPQVDNLGQAAGKIRRRVLESGDWGIWNGWLPSRNVEISKIADGEVLHRCGLAEPEHPLVLGETLDRGEFAIAGRSFEKVNVVTALKGMGKSHLAKVLILQLIEQGMACVVFDVNREYNRLPKLVENDGAVTVGGTVVLTAAGNFRVTIEGFGRRAFIRLFEQFSPTEPTRNTFELRINQAFERLERLDEGNSRAEASLQQPRPFFNMSYVRQQFPPNKTNEQIYRAIMDRLEQIEAMNLFAETEEEGASFDQQYALCAQKGGALVVDLALLSSKFARDTFVGATLDMVERVAASQVRKSSASHRKLPFVFFEEAHLYASGERIDNLVTRARHLGITSTFVTNMVTHLSETVLRQVDNLFLLYLPHRDDVKYVAKSATTDEETVSAFARRIERHHAMVVGESTGQYPLVFKVDGRQDVDMAGETQYAFPKQCD